MILDKKKFRKGIKKIGVAIALLPGPILFVAGSHNDNLSAIIKFSLPIIGVICMAISLIMGIIGLKIILSSFFEKPNE
ncbi:MAG: hypothetical protein CMP65_00970 [Flavobacteriales bacterium]|nr:hypothetical protein [Flavobacteriales bacterium]|tara:strand:+ start:4000 stop:4233 length:234 start_codon:yes stop_codon:yes gene_type:complete